MMFMRNREEVINGRFIPVLNVRLEEVWPHLSRLLRRRLFKWKPALTELEQVQFGSNLEPRVFCYFVTVVNLGSSWKARGKIAPRSLCLCAFSSRAREGRVEKCILACNLYFFDALHNKTCMTRANLEHILEF